MSAFSNHIKARLPEYIVSILVSGLGFAIVAVWFAINLYFDIQWMKCKLGMREGIRICEVVPTLAEDLAKAPDEPTNTD